MRIFEKPAPSGTSAFSVYVGYYESQIQGKSIHSPKNCLPGNGWEPISAGTTAIPVGSGAVQVNRYLLGKESQTALVYYWYQGRGRIAANEYKVKWNLLQDKALRGRSEETLVRIVVPYTGSAAAADSLATSVAAELMPQIEAHLPPYPGRSVLKS
jgi:EpsI family protein